MSFNIVDYFVFFIIFLVILKFLKLIKYVVESSSTRKHLPLREFWNGHTTKVALNMKDSNYKQSLCGIMGFSDRI